MLDLACVYFGQKMLTNRQIWESRFPGPRQNSCMVMRTDNGFEATREGCGQKPARDSAPGAAARRVNSPDVGPHLDEISTVFFAEMNAMETKHL